MIDEMDGRPKFDLARDAVRAMLPLLGPKSQVALRAYGHRKRSIEAGADVDTQLLLPLADYDAAKFEAALVGLRPRGKTPMALSLEQAAGDLQSAASDANPVTVVLLTDGGEDTNPPRDPVAAAARLAGMKGVTLHIVGFDVNQEDWNRQLRQMADAALGQYWPAPRGEELKRSLRSALLGDPDGFIVQDATGKEVFRGRFGDRKRLLEGKYTMLTQFAGREFRQELWINTGAQTAVAFDAIQAMRDPAAKPIAASGADHSRAADAPKFCTHCGAPLKPGAKFCTECGYPVNGGK